MKKALVILLLSLFATLEAKNSDDKRKKPIYASQKEELSTKSVQQGVVPTNRYFGIEAMYGTGKQKARVEYSMFSDDAISYSEVSFKLGVGAYDKNRFEISLTQNKNFILKDSSESSDFASGSSIDIAYLIMLDFFESAVSNNIFPFIKVGAGFGKFDIKNEYKSDYGNASIYTRESKIGLGIFSMLTERMELSLLYNNISREFQTIENYDSRLIEISHEIDSLSVGANYRF